MAVGKVEWFRGSFGFIKPDDGGVDVFVHWRGIDGPTHEHKRLHAGDRVEYDVEIGADTGKPIAVGVRRIG